MKLSDATIPSSTDVLIIGAGPAGIFCALSLLRRGADVSITIVEKGLPIERRSCPKERVGHCVNCQPCRITTGFSGAGAFSDGKLSLSYEVGGDLPELIGADLAQATIERADSVYLEFGADPHVEGHICQFHAFVFSFFQKFFCEMKACRRRGYRTFDLRIYCLISVPVLGVVGSCNVRRKRHLADLL